MVSFAGGAAWCEIAKCLGPQPAASGVKRLRVVAAGRRGSPPERPLRLCICTGPGLDD
jgi:hypothetical protein